MDSVLNYLAGLHAALDRLHVKNIYKAISMLHAARLKGNTVFVLGNGGSASTAGHFVCDLAKGTRQPGLPPFKVISLTDNMAIFSAYANDEGYEYTLAEQLANFIAVDDIVIAISTSGNSKNILRAIEYATRVGARTIGFTGNDGGMLRHLVQLEINVPSTCIQHIEDIHLALFHMISDALTSMWKPTQMVEQEKATLPQTVP